MNVIYKVLANCFAALFVVVGIATVCGSQSQLGTQETVVAVISISVALTILRW